VPVDEVTDNRRLRTSGGPGMSLEALDVPAIQFQRHRFHALMVLLL
jgi:hypothetical protein